MAIDPACREGLYLLLSELPLYKYAITICFGFAVIEKPALKDSFFVKRLQEGNHVMK